MTPTRLRECIALAYWSLRDLAIILDLDPRLVRRWATGSVGIPHDVGHWLEAVGQFHASRPPPRFP